MLEVTLYQIEPLNNNYALHLAPPTQRGGAGDEASGYRPFNKLEEASP